MIVKRNRASGLWEDQLGRNFTNAVRFDLPDLDVFALDALADPPRQSAAFAHVGTVLFNMIVNPSNGKLYVSNTEARNDVRFETGVRGDLHEARITVHRRRAGSAAPPQQAHRRATRRLPDEADAAPP